MEKMAESKLPLIKWLIADSFNCVHNYNCEMYGTQSVCGTTRERDGRGTRPSFGREFCFPVGMTTGIPHKYQGPPGKYIVLVWRKRKEKRGRFMDEGDEKNCSQEKGKGESMGSWRLLSQ